MEKNGPIIRRKKSVLKAWDPIDSAQMDLFDTFEDAAKLIKNPEEMNAYKKQVTKNIVTMNSNYFFKNIFNLLIQFFPENEETYKAKQAIVNAQEAFFFAIEKSDFPEAF